MRRFLFTLMLVGGLATSARAEVKARDLALMIGPVRSVVRELREVAFTARVSEVAFEGIPATADLNTLQVGSARQGVSLLSWQREGSAVAPLSAVTWRPGEPLRRATPATPSAAVRCRLESDNLRTRWVEIVYQVEGLAWRADYEINVRGDVANHLEPLSMDIEGRLVISNGTGRVFPKTRVLLVGGEKGTPPIERQASGQLMLDDESPLADLWRKRPRAQDLLHAYPLEETVNLPASGEVSVRFIGARRQSAERLYSMVADDFPLNAEGAWRPLTRYLTLMNDAGHGLGRSLPPGEALIYLGGVRGGLYQRAWLDHTDRNGELHVGLGASRGVTATRRAEPRTSGAAGMPEQTVVLKLANALPTAVKVEVVDRPPVPLAWDVVRSSRPFEKRDQRLFFALPVEARSETEITYTVRVMEPER